jgi:hypothetical protein
MSIRIEVWVKEALTALFKKCWNRAHRLCFSHTQKHYTQLNYDFSQVLPFTKMFIQVVS